VTDEFFGAPFHDSDEWRDSPFRHRYVHGGFEGTDTRFVVIMPEPAQFRGRFVQFLQGGMGGSEHQGAMVGAHLVAAENGAAYVESNQGHIGNDLSGLRGQASVLSWRASAQTARHARQVMAETYGAPPQHGYVVGGSGGGMRSIDCLEHAPDLWDGAVPFIVNRNGLHVFNWSVAAWAGAVLGVDKVAAVVDALDAGGSGDPFAVLDTDEQRRALATLYRAGYCRGAESQLEPNPLWILGLQLLGTSDPTYYEDFWTVPGYEGADDDPLARSLHVQDKAIVTDAVTLESLRAAGPGGGLDTLNAAVLGRAMTMKGPIGIRMDTAIPPERLLGATLTVTSGKAAGRALRCTGSVAGTALAFLDPVGFGDIEAGDSIEIDNRDLVAFAYYHRHLVDARYPVMRQFLIDGRPIYRQRPVSFDAMPVPKGRFEGKMILLQHLADRECWPSCATEYVGQLLQAYGGELESRFRIWWIENAAHLVPLTRPGLTRLINYSGTWAQALRDVIAWVEEGVAPPPSTPWQLSEDNQLVVPRAAQDRGGIQPAVEARVNGGPVASVRVGEEVRLEGVAEAPPGAGTIVSAQWDFDGSGTWALRDDSVDGSAARITSRAVHQYDEPGTYFATFRAGLHRDGDAHSRLRLVTNLARVRVVVT